MKRKKILSIILTIVICFNSGLGVFAAGRANCPQCGHLLESRGYNEHWTEPCHVHTGCTIIFNVAHSVDYCPACLYVGKDTITNVYSYHYVPDRGKNPGEEMCCPVEICEE